MTTDSTPITEPDERLALTVVNEQSLAAAFTEWDRRYREEPERFEAEARRLLHGTPETYGDACAPYLLAILEEQDQAA